jgi:hypothetical protein
LTAVCGVAGTDIGQNLARKATLRPDLQAPMLTLDGQTFVQQRRINRPPLNVIRTIADGRSECTTGAAVSSS